MRTIFFLLFALLLPLAAPAAECDNPARLRFSLVPQGNAKTDAAIFQPLFAALQSELGKPVDLLFPNSYGAVVEGLLAGNIDLAFLGPASYASARRSTADIQAFASYTRISGPLQEEGAFYRSLLIVRQSSSYQTASALRGARVALVDPVSTSGAVVPRRFFAPLIQPGFDKFFGQVVYSGGHDKSIVALVQAQVDAAFVASNHLSDFISAGKAREQDFRVLWQSDRIPLDPFVVRNRLCAPIREAIRKVFLAEDGKRFPAVLKKLEAQRFVAVSDDDYRIIHDLFRAPDFR